MAKETTPPVEENEWEEISVGIGEQWDFDKRGDLIGVIVGAKSVDLPEHSQREDASGELRTSAGIWEFMLPDTGEMVFLWDSYQLTEALKDVGSGDLVKIHFDGYRSFTGSDGPRQVKQYKVSKKKS